MFSEDERIARLCLIRTESVGPVTFYKLLARFGSAIEALRAFPDMARRAGRKKTPQLMTREQAEKELQNLNSFGAQMIVYGDEHYPEMLSHIDDAPPILNVMGDPSFLNRSSLGIVGARNASANGRRFTMKIASEMGNRGHVIVSGLARGIDTAAHDASLATGTVAVLAGGIDQIYPTENTNLYHQICKNGCVVSEMPLGTKPTAHHFPRRNRIVSGLSKGVLVVEASMKSGSLITARLAAEQGREVFAVPGFPGDPRSAGPNSLIQNGAKLVMSVDDVLSDFMHLGQAKAISPFQSHLFETISDNDDMPMYEPPLPSENLYEKISDGLSSSPVDIDTLCALCDASISSVQAVLLELEILGCIQRHPGNRVSKVSR